MNRHVFRSANERQRVLAEAELGGGHAQASSSSERLGEPPSQGLPFCLNPP
jgi:hypothetical protein